MSLRSKILLHLLPLLIPLIFLFAGGLLFTLLQSFTLFLPYSYSDFLSGYKQVLSDPWFYKSFFFSIYIAIVSTLAALSIGTALAYFIWKLPLKWQGFTIVYKLALILPHIAIAYFIILFFSKTGIISALFFQLGLTSNYQQFPSFVYANNGWGIILAYIIKENPFVILMVLGSLQKFDGNLIVTARMLGENNFKIFFKIVLPFLLPVINITFIILFLYSFGAFDIPFLLGGSRPEVLSIHVYNLYFKRDLINRPEAMAVLIIMFIFSLLFVAGYLSRPRKTIDWEQKK